MKRWIPTVLTLAVPLAFSGIAQADHCGCHKEKVKTVRCCKPAKVKCCRPVSTCGCATTVAYRVHRSPCGCGATTTAYEGTSFGHEFVSGVGHVFSPVVRVVSYPFHTQDVGYTTY